jgi:hypothetical protein
MKLNNTLGTPFQVLNSKLMLWFFEVPDSSVALVTEKSSEIAMQEFYHCSGSPEGMTARNFSTDQVAANSPHVGKSKNPHVYSCLVAVKKSDPKYRSLEGLLTLGSGRYVQ